MNAAHIRFDKFRAQPCFMLIIQIRDSEKIINKVLQKKICRKSFLNIIIIFCETKMFQGELL